MGKGKETFWGNMGTVVGRAVVGGALIGGGYLLLEPKLKNWYLNNVPCKDKIPLPKMGEDLFCPISAGTNQKIFIVDTASGNIDVNPALLKKSAVGKEWGALTRDDFVNPDDINIASDENGLKGVLINGGLPNAQDVSRDVVTHPTLKTEDDFFKEVQERKVEVKNLAAHNAKSDGFLSIPATVANSGRAAVSAAKTPPPPPTPWYESMFVKIGGPVLGLVIMAIGNFSPATMALAAIPIIAPFVAKPLMDSMAKKPEDPKKPSETPKEKSEDGEKKDARVGVEKETVVTLAPGENLPSPLPANAPFKEVNSNGLGATRNV